VSRRNRKEPEPLYPQVRGFEEKLADGTTRRVLEDVQTNEDGSVTPRETHAAQAPTIAPSAAQLVEFIDDAGEVQRTTPVPAPSSKDIGRDQRKAFALEHGGAPVERVIFEQPIRAPWSSHGGEVFAYPQWLIAVVPEGDFVLKETNDFGRTFRTNLRGSWW
jgi:hypothetical protein